MALQISFNPCDLTDDERAFVLSALDAKGDHAGPSSPTYVGMFTTAPTDPTVFATVSTDDNGPTDPTVFAGPGPLPVGGAPSVPPPPPAASPVDVDADGLPWDARIHAGGRAKNADGRWRAKRGVGDDYRLNVVAELRAALGAPEAPAAVPLPPAPTVPPPPPAMSDSATPASAPLPEPTDSSPAVLAPSLPAPSAGDLFGALMRKITPAQTAGKLTSVEISTILAGVGLTALRDLMVRPDLIPSVEEQITALIAAQG